MTDDGMPPKSAIDPSVARKAVSCWLSTKPWLMASFGSKSPTSLYTTTCALDEYRPLPPTRSAITANASGTFGSGTCDQPFGIGSTMVSALKSRLFCGSICTPLALKKSASVPEAAGVIVACGGAGTAGVKIPEGEAPVAG